MAVPAPSLRISSALDGVVVGELDHVCIVLWRGPVTRPRFEAQRAGLAEVVRSNPAGAALLIVIEPTAKPPDDEMRRASAAMVREHESALRGIACIVEGTGFVAALGRSALSAMAMLLGPRKVPFAIHATVGAGAVWLARHTTVPDVASAVEAMRARMQPWPDGAP